VNGSDGAEGNQINASLKTLTEAYSRCVSGRGDVVYLLNNGLSTGTARLASLLTWAKNNTHLVGLCAPSQLSQRARISHSATAGIGFPLLFKVAAAGCTFQNLQWFQGYAVDEDQTCLELTSAAQRCVFSNCHIAGMGAALPAARAGSMTLKLGGAENVFQGCTIGLDTESRTAANSEVVVTVGLRNIFRDCLFPTFAGNAGHLFLSAANGTIDRWLLMQRCIFINAIQSTATAMTSALSVGSAMGGMVILDGCSLYGATYWVGADTAKVMLIGAPGAANSQLIGIGLTADKP